ncbi:MAG TPA: hypothetical protein VMF89_30190 [Polyangiales bacterium]|nr:hypothetical protein [Polyangiales bacterium]
MQGKNGQRAVRDEQLDFAGLTLSGELEIADDDLVIAEQDELSNVAPSDDSGAAAGVSWREGSKSAVVDGVTLYTEGGDDADRVLLIARIAALLSGTPEVGSQELHAGGSLRLSNGGGRLDHRPSGVSIRARTGRLGAKVGRALLRRIADLWILAEDTDPAEATVARGRTTCEAASCDELRLHRYHLAPDREKVKLSHPGLQLSATVAGGTSDQRQAFAWRIAFAWNLAEGWPAMAAEAGAIRELDDEVHRLVEAYERGEECSEILAQLAQSLRRRDRLQDTSHGRVNDCSECLQSSARR